MSRRRRSREGPVDPAELEGYLEGVTRRLAAASDAIRRELGVTLTGARSAFAGGDLSRARSLLEQIDDRLSEADEEPELSEYPRGLVDYVPVGSRGSPRPDEEDPVPNRLKLLGRLLAFRQSQGGEVESLLRRLGEAEAALRHGDRAKARRIGEEVQDALERDPGPPPQA